MRKIAIIFLTVMLASCAAGPILTGQVDNPVTPTVAFQLQASMDEVTVAAGSYAKLERCSRAPPPCSSQAVVNQLRIYVNKGQTATLRLTEWALGNTTLNGPALYRAALIAVGTAQDFAIKSGVPL